MSSPSMTANNIEDIYPLSPMQQGMLFHSLLAPESGVYVEQTSWELDGELDVEVLQSAWQRVVDRHSALRTSFVWEDVNQPVQVVHRRVVLPVQRLDWSDLSPEEGSRQLHAYLAAERKKGFDFAQAPLMRLSMIRLGEGKHILTWCHHHLLLDGWCLPILLGEVFEIYGALRSQREPGLEPARPYRDYIAWLMKQDMAKAETFWRGLLRDFEEATPVAKYHPIAGSSERSSEYEISKIRLSRQCTAGLHDICRKNQFTISTIIQGAWALLLSRYSGTTDVIFGATVSGRPPDLPGVESMVGLFINTLPVRVRLTPSETLLDLFKRLHALQGVLRQFEYTPLLRIHEWSGIPQGKPLFENIIVFENYPVDRARFRQDQGLLFREIHSFERTNFPLTLVSAPSDELQILLAYETKHFSSWTIERMLGQLQRIFEQIEANPWRRIAEVDLLDTKERRQVVVDWNRTHRELPLDLCVHERIALCAREYPDAPAVICSDRQITYRDLDRRANQLAQYLRKLGVGEESLVAICTERCIEMIVGLLGVLKAGAAYLPIDASLPAERIRFMLEDANISVLLTQQALVEALSIDVPRTICLDSDWKSIALESAEEFRSRISVDGLAYVIFTSGSTGRPKGVAVTHRGLINHALATQEAWTLTSKDRMLQFLSLSFDAAGEEIYPTLVGGGALVLHPEVTQFTAADLLRFCDENAITILHFPCAYWTQLVDELAANDHVIPAGLRLLAIGGESPSRDKYALWRRLTGNQLRGFNVYGPTETTIAATHYEIGDLMLQDPMRPGSIPIGRAIANVRTYLLDAQLVPVPVGVPGELCIGGAGMARGYYRRPELTAERFVPDPFSEAGGARLYRTGDRARFLPDGNLEFLGRIDDQVKIRGFRIELGEIEARLRDHPSVRDAVVIAREDTPGDRCIAAYIVCRDGLSVTPGELKSHLRMRLPEYMIPASVDYLDELPHSPSGKVDRGTLPAPGRTDLESASGYAAPRTLTEDLLANLWAGVLSVPRVSTADNFFVLGGHSLKATQLVSRIRDAFAADIPLQTIFETATLAELAKEIDRHKANGRLSAAPPMQRLQGEQELPLSFAQQRLWFLDQLQPGATYYNIPAAFRLRGELDFNAWRSALSAILHRHEILRTIFVSVGGKPMQRIVPAFESALPLIDLSDRERAAQEDEVGRLMHEEARHSFDLSKGPLLRTSLIRLAPDEHVVLLNMHHIIADGWSMGILVDELVRLYAAGRAGEDLVLPQLPIQYSDFAAWQRKWLQGPILDEQIAYWKKQLGGVPPVLELPTDRPRPAVQSLRAARASVLLPLELTKAVLDLSRKVGATTFMTLLAAFQVLLHRYTGQSDIAVGCPIAGRRHSDVERLIGFFVNTLVFRTRFDAKDTFRQVLGKVREAALGAYSHQDVPFEKLVEELHPVRDLSHAPIFQVMFVFQNVPLQHIELEGLTVEKQEIATATANFDLTLEMMETPQGFVADLEYNPDLFDAGTVVRMLAHFKNLLAALVKTPNHLIATAPLLAQEEQERQLIHWNQTTGEFPGDICVHQCFESWARRQPDAFALIYATASEPSGVRSLRYQELNRRANQLARYLKRSGLKREGLVGICTERSFEMVVAMLATLKAGGAFVPLDPAYPRERLSYMVEDANIQILLAQEQLPELVAASRCVRLDSDWPIIDMEDDSNPEIGCVPTQLAYVIYTSGSTGRPKGTMLTHHGLCNLAAEQERSFAIRPGSKVLQFSSLSFDASVWEFVMALLNGATLCLTSRDTVSSGHDLVDLMGRLGISTVTLPPSVLAVLPQVELPGLRTLITAGEKCTGDLVMRWGGGRDFFNAYGPTETTVCASMHRCKGSDSQGPPIGRPIQNFDLYILDPNLQPVPVGVPGELYIGGVGLARGYLFRPDLTAERFIPHPFAKKRGARLYKSGDVCRFLQDGNIEMLGRADLQVKVRGFRIELGEIETVLSEYPGVRDVAVVARELTAGEKQLIAYLVAQEGGAPAVVDLRSYLRQRLPEYMVPAVYMILTAMPLTPSKKIDRHALPAPDRDRMGNDKPFIAPGTDTEIRLAAIASQLLNISSVGASDNFFDLGGHSLMATQFISRVYEEFSVEMALRILFEKPTIAEFAREVEKMRTSAGTSQRPKIKAIARESVRVKQSELT